MVNELGVIADIGLDEDIAVKYQGCDFHNTIDAQGKCVVPGLIDGHTHPVWVGDRVHEFAMKLVGMSCECVFVLLSICVFLGE